MGFVFLGYEKNNFNTKPFPTFSMLQPNKNFTWTLLAQRKLTNYLDLNLSYFERRRHIYGKRTIKGLFFKEKLKM